MTWQAVYKASCPKDKLPLLRGSKVTFGLLSLDQKHQSLPRTRKGTKLASLYKDSERI